MIFLMHKDPKTDFFWNFFKQEYIFFEISFQFQKLKLNSQFLTIIPIALKLG